MRDLVLQQRNRLEDFAPEFVREAQRCPQYPPTGRQDQAWQDLGTLAANDWRRDRFIFKAQSSMVEERLKHSLSTAQKGA